MLSLVLAFLALSHASNGARIVNSLPANASADYVIVGGGLSGMVLAHRVSANGSFSVIVLEAGPDVRDVAEINDPYSSMQLSNDGHYNWLWPTVNQTVGGVRKVISGGKALGGSTSINGMYWTRGTRSQYDAIATLNNDPSWSFDAFFPTMKKAERFYPPSPALHAEGADFEPTAHGYYGPVGVSFVRPYHGAKIARAIVAAAETVFGLSRGDVAGGDPNVAAQIAMSVYPVGNHSVRSSSANAYLYPLFPAGANTSAAHHGLTVLPGHQATKIVWAGNAGTGAARATGVEYGAADGSGARAVVNAMREVIVSSGAIMSPAFLLHSGVGAPAELHAVGITPVVDLPSVGTNLQDQAIGGLYYANLTQAAAAHESTGGGAQTSANLAFPSLTQLFGTHTAKNMSAELRASARTRAAAFVASGAHTSVDGLAAQFELQAEMIAEGAPVAEIDVIVFGGQVGYVPWNLLPQYRGTVKLNSSDPFEYPLIDPAYLQTDFDLSVIVAIAQGARHLWAAAPLAEYVEPELFPGYTTLPTNASDADWAAYIRNVYLPVYHPIGTASMLPRADGGAVDTAFKLYGTVNVRVVDASILPIQLSAHLSATLYGVAEKAAESILSGR